MGQAMEPPLLICVSRTFQKDGAPTHTRGLAGERRSWSPGAVGIALAVASALLFLAWRQFSSWYIFGSAYSDLPGQDSLALVRRVELVVVVIIALGAGRLARVFSRSRSWVGALVAVSPFLFLILAAVDEGNPADALPRWAVICTVALLGAYSPHVSAPRALLH